MGRQYPSDGEWTEPSRRRVLGLLAAGSLGALPGCGGSPSGGATTTAPGTTPTTRPSRTTVTTTTGGNLTIEAPDEHPQDRPVELRVVGAEPGERVTVEAAMADYGGVEWTSEATFDADDRGVVNLSTRAPLEGTYGDADPMGWLWSMTPPSIVRPFYHRLTADRKRVRLRASSGSDSVETGMTLRLNDPGIDEIRIENGELVGVLHEPPGEGPHPGVLVLHGSGGEPLRRRSELLASRGYAALALRYFGPENAIPDRLARIPLSYFERAQSWLRDRAGVRDAPVGVVGVSRGGELALLLGARFEWVGAVVSYVGSGVAWDSGANPSKPPWIHDGEPVDYLTGKGPAARTDEGYYRYRPVFTRRLESVSETRLREASFAVENTRGPILLISGEDDQIWPSTRLSRIAVERLRNADFGYAFDHLAYRKAGHFITDPYVPTANRRTIGDVVFGGAAAGYARAYADSWPTVLSYLKKGIKE